MSITLIEDRTEDRVKERRLVGVSGLCKACARQEACTYLRSFSAPTFDCDEFEGEEPESPKQEVLSSRGESRIDRAVDMEAIGMCRACDLNSSCTFPRPEGGVWHCEEYR